jgi:predicted AAA+ superfamily ATPase
MAKKEIFKTLILDYQERTLPDLVARAIALPQAPSRVMALVGARRTGKTSLLYQFVQQLEAQGIPREQTLYLNFEDDRLFPLQLSELDQLLVSYYELYPQMMDQPVYLLLDEVQNVEGWEKYIRRIHDTENVHIYITGSSAKMLSREIATHLRGRSLPVEVFPLSFSEFINARGVALPYGDAYSSKQKVRFRTELDQYIEQGGFPELLNWKGEKNPLWQDYIDLIMFRDIVERHNVQNQSLLKFFLQYLLINAGNLLSINKMYRDFKSQGRSLSKQTLYELLDYLEEAYVLFTVPFYSTNIKQQQRNPRKIYPLDVGLKHALSYQNDIGRLYECIVFLHLRRKLGSGNVLDQSPVYYWKGQQEVDFVTCNSSGQPDTLINVCYDLSDPKTREREINNLVEGMTHFDIHESLLITADESREEIVTLPKGSSGKKARINILPLWQWLLKYGEDS